MLKLSQEFSLTGNYLNETFVIFSSKTKQSVTSINSTLMFHRFLRLLLLSTFAFSTWISASADCPDTNPRITGPDVVGASTNPVQYITPFVSGHTYAWVVTELPGGAVVGTSSTNILNQVWNTPGDYKIELTEGILGNTCTSVATPMFVTVKPMLAAYYYYEFDKDHGCFYNEVSFTATGDGKYPPQDPSISYDWKYRVYPAGAWVAGVGAGINPPTGSIVKITFPTTSGVTYEVNMKVSKTIAGRLWEDEINDYVYVDPDKYKPVAVLNTPATPGCLYDAFTFSAVGSQPTSMPTGETFKYVDWDFGDGTTAHYDNTNGPPPLTTTHTYTNYGYGIIVTLKLTNTINCEVTKTIVIDVPNTIPVAAFTTAQTCVNFPAPFTDISIPSTGTITDWWWTWGDGSPVDHYTTANPPPVPVTHTYTDLLPHVVTLKVRNSNGCEHTSTPVTVQAEPSPKADFTYQTVICDGDIVQFNSDLSSPLTGTPIVTYDWNFGDPASPYNIISGPNPTHQFTGPGNYIVTLTVTNQAGCSNTKTLTSPLVVSPHPDIDFSIVQSPTNVYQQTFTAIINPLQNVGNNVMWNFGDGTNGFGSPINHTFPGPGGYTITCTAIDMVSGCQSVSTHTVLLGAPPASCFTANPPNQCQNAPVLFIPCPPGGLITTEDWDFGDGVTAHFDPPNVPANPSHIYTSAGPYLVTRVVNQNTPMEATFTLWVTIFEAPTANFIWFSDPLHLHQGQACSGETVYFQDQSYSNSTPPGVIYQWAWDFDDPLSGPLNTSTVANPTHTFTPVALGGKAVYNVSLKVKENLQDCESPAVVIPVTINPPIPVDYTVPTVACVDQIVNFQSTGMDPLTIAQWTWDFGDGLPVSHDPISTTHAYQAANVGVLTTTLTVVDIHGCTNSISKTITVIPSPSAGFTYTSPTCEGNQIQFTDQSVPGGPAGDHIVDWYWTWGDGSIPDPQHITFGQNPNVTHTFPVVLGTYVWPVKLRVVNTYGCENEITINVSVLPAPVASFTTVLGTYQCVGQPVQFQDLSNANGGGPVVSWLWNFGDAPPNNTSTAQNPTHTYAAGGPYTVTLQVTTANGCKSTVFSAPVTINELPVADFTFTTVCEGLPTVFTDASTINALGTATYLWDFGGGVTSNSPSPTYVFPTAGLHPVTLQVTNSNGCVHQVTHQVMVYPKAIAAFHFTTPSCQNATMTFTSDSYIPATPGSAASIASWDWDFGDATTGSGPLVVHTYSDGFTSHQVILTVTTSDGCISTITQIVNHLGVPTANFSHTGYECENQTINFFDNSSTVGGIAIAGWLWNFDDPGAVANNTSTLQNPTHDFTTTGPHDVSLTVTDINGCKSVPKVIRIIILAKPVAAFTYTNACLGNGTQFTDASTPAGSIAQWQWQFDDGTQAIGPNPVHFFGTSGVHSVILTVTTTDGCFQSVTQLVEVYPKPVVTFTSTAPVCANNPVTFTDYSTTGHGYIATRTWDFGDGPPDPPTPNPQVTHTYTTGGTYNVTLTVLTSDGCTESRTMPVQIQFSPNASFFHSTTLCPNQQVDFNSSPSSPNGGSPINAWFWDFGDLPSGNQNNSTAPNPSHTFATAGPYTITLTVTNVDGCTSTYSEDITISAAPTALFTTSPAQGCQGQSTSFDASASNTAGNSDIVSFNWNFGDTQTGIGQVVNHTYSNYGYYTVTLNIINASGCTASVSHTVFVEPKPIAQFTTSQANCMDMDVSFYDQSFIPAGFSGSISNWDWDFGDGNTAAYTPATVPVVVTHGYTDNLPVHTVTLTVTTDFGCINVVSHDVNSIPSPIAHITYDQTTCVNQPIQFHAGTSSPNGGTSITGYNWDFGDGGTSTLQDPIHSYVTTTPKTVTLSVTNASGCVSVTPDSKTITPNAKPVANFSADSVCFGGPTTFTSTTTGGTITTYLWDFGDSQTSTAPSPVTHTYASSGTFQVKLTVTTNQGCTKDTTKAVVVYGKPNAAFTTSGASCAGDSIAFSAVTSTTSHGYIVRYIWDFNDLTAIQSSTVPTIKHKFVNGGTYNVKLTIKTSDSCSAEKINPVVVHEVPMAAFQYPPVICAKSSTQFTDISQGGGSATLTNWTWTFGDPGSGANNSSNLQNPLHIFTVGGNDTVKLIVANAYGCRDTVFHVVTVHDVPHAEFNADTACIGSPTQFTDASTTPTPGSVTAWLWNFGDPASGTLNTSTLQNPTHTYNTQGSYTVNLMVTNNNTCTKDTSIVIVVNPKPTAMFNYTAACIGDSTQFTDLSISPGSQIQSWYWDFGCGTPATCNATIQNPKWMYSTPGTYNVKLRVTNFAGCQDSVTIAIVARPKPTAAFTSNAYFCPAGKVDFQDISTASAAAIAERLWIFEPGYTSNIPNPSHTFTVTNMNYAVTLIVTDTYGCKDTIVDSVFVKPGFSFTFTNDSVCQGYPTHFTPVLNTAGDSLYSVRWNFGDPASGPNNTSLSYKPQHVFTQPGTYIVKLKAYNTDNCVDSVFREVTVYKTPEPLFSYNSVPCDSTIHFFDSTLVAGSGTITSWLWKWGDGGSTLINAPGPGDTSHLYVNEGIYNVTLIMTSSHGCIDSVSRNVQRYPCIQAGFSTNDSLCARYKIAFADTSLPVTRINHWTWSWGDGTPDTSYTVHHSPIYHTYASGGTYPVTLTIESLVNGTTISDNRSSQVVINPTPVTFFSNPPVCLHEYSLFRDTSVVYGEPVTKWQWNFGPTSIDTASTRNPSNRYDTAGIYNVKLIVNNRWGCKDSLIKPTRVYGLPQAHYTNEAACNGDPTFFFDKSVESADTTLRYWRWNFGDNTTQRDTSQLQDPSYIYPDTLTYSVKMIVRDNFGCIDTVDSTVRVHVTPVSSFTVANNYNGKQGQVKMNNLSTGAQNYKWDFGNNKYSDEKDPVALFTEDGTYSIKLISLNQFNCSDTTFFKYELLFKGLYVPNAFSPSATNLGVRLFKPVGINLKQYNVMVFDIWGHMMWESNKLDDHGSPTEGWDGTFEGQLMPQGNYMWKISAMFVDDSPWEGSNLGVGGTGSTKGTVTLIR